MSQPLKAVSCALWQPLKHRVCPRRSLDRKLQRPLLGKSRTLPSIPQSPLLSRLAPPEPYRDEMPEQKPYKPPSASEHQKGCTVPSAGECWARAAPLLLQDPSKAFLLLLGHKSNSSPRGVDSALKIALLGELLGLFLPLVESFFELDT